MSIIKELKYDKIKINWNKNPIPMSTFLSFLTIPVEKSTDHLGASTGWTRFHNKEYKLEVGGGICDGGHWLDSIQYGTKLQNQYNNYVNPFYMFDVLTIEGKKFFLEYYENEIKDLLIKKHGDVLNAEIKLKDAEKSLDAMRNELKTLKSSCNAD